MTVGKLDRERARQLADCHAALLFQARQDRPARGIDKRREGAIEV